MSSCTCCDKCTHHPKARYIYCKNCDKRPVRKEVNILMTDEEEFRRLIYEDLLPWISKRVRPRSHWILSVEDWCRARYAVAYAAEQKAEKEVNR